MKELTPLKAIRSWCIDCSGGNSHEVKRCEHYECPLFKYRFGKNPSRKGIGGRVGRVGQRKSENHNLSIGNSPRESIVEESLDPVKQERTGLVVCKTN